MRIIMRNSQMMCRVNCRKKQLLGATSDGTGNARGAIGLRVYKV